MKKQEISYSDDFTNEVSEDVKTCPFGWLGTYGEIDLDSSNFEYYNKIFQELISHGRTGTQIKKEIRKGQDKKTTSENRRYSMKVRQWAHDNGHHVNPKGRIPKAVIAAYEEQK